VRGITDLMIMPGLINLDFADIRTVMSEMGKAMMGTGEASGEGRAIEAAQKAIANPLLDEVTMRGAKGVIINITGGDDLKLMEVDEAASYIRDMVDSDANIIVGSAFNRDLDGIMRVSVVATGIDAAAKPMPVTQPAKKASGSAFLAQPSIFSAPPPAAEPAPAETTEPVAIAAPAAEPAPLMLELPEAQPVAVEPETADDEDDVIDLAAADRMDEPAPASFTFTPIVPPAPVVSPPAEPAPAPVAEAPVADERPLTLFERMMGMSRKPRAPEPTTSLAPAPSATPAAPKAGDDDVPGFMRRQVNR
jgi:cell division protein FtsZ